MKVQALLVAAIVGSTAFAGEIAFDGGPEGTGLELTAAENWDGDVLPGADDVAVIPIGSEAKTLTMATDWSVKGLKFTSPSAKLTIGADSTTTLTIGADGIVVPTSQSNANGLEFNVKLATSSDQTWNLGKQILGTYATISGDDVLVITNLYNATHYAAPRYDGSIKYYGTVNAASTLSYREAAKWANDVSAYSTYEAMFYLQMDIPDKVWSFSSVFPKGTRLAQGNSYLGVNLVAKSGTTAIYDDNAGEIYLPNLSYYSPRVRAGDWQMDGGAITGKLYWIVGSVSEAGKASMHMNGGEVMVPPSWGDEGAFVVGAANDWNENLMYQAGGTVGAPHTWIGGKWGTWEKRTGYSEYAMSGGSLHHYNRATQATEICLAYYANNSDQCQPGVFSQTGGDAYASVTFGGSTREASTDNKIGWGFGLLRLAGGTFTLPTGGITTHKSWNSTATSNSSYRVSLAGGTLKSEAAKISAQVDFAPGVSTVETPKDVLFEGPVWGAGTLRKTGACDLTVVDASRLTGAIDVQEGSVTVLGAYADPDDATCIKWTGDSAMANGYRDGDEVAEWPEANNGGAHKAGALTLPSGDNFVYQPGLPKLVENAFNGHAGVKFSSSAMAVPKEMNPLATQSVFSVAVVLRDRWQNYGPSSDRMGTTGLSGHDWGYNGMILGSCTIGGGWGFDGWGLAYSSVPQAQGAILGLNSSYSLPSTRGGMGDDAVHVIVATVDKGVGTLNVDGAFTNKVMLANRAANINDALYFGFNSNNDNLFSSEDKYRARTFNGTFAEVRCYPGRALDVCEQNALVRTLLAKYGTVADVAKVTPGSADGVVTVADQPIADVPAATVTFDAGDLALADGAEVESWTSTDGEKAFLLAKGGAGATAPTFVKGGTGERPVVRFDAAAKTALGLEAASVPWAGQKSLTAAVVFRTTTDGLDGINETYSPGAAPKGRGILSSAGDKNNARNAMSVSLRTHGTVGAVCHNTGLSSVGSAVDTCVTTLEIYRRKPCGLDDGALHVAVFSINENEGGKAYYRVTVDGMLTETSGAAVPGDQGSFDLLLGSMNASLDKHFTGDIAEVQLFDRGLTRAQMDTLTESLCKKYGTRPLARRLYADGELTARGLGVTNVNVAAGAAFNVVRSATDPWTLRAGMTLTGAGRVNGSVRYGEGSVFDPGAERPAVEDLQIADGATVRIGAGGLPYDLTAVASVSGTVKLDVTALDLETLKARTKLALFTPGAVADGTTFELVGGADNMSAGVRDDGSLVLHIRRGTIMIIR